MFLGKNPGGIGAGRQGGLHGIESGGVNLMKTTAYEPEPLQEVKNQQITELTDMVKTLLEE